jgi:hypothetical protein
MTASDIVVASGLRISRGLKPARKGGVLDHEDKVPRETDSVLEGDGLKFFLFIKLIDWQTGSPPPPASARGPRSWRAISRHNRYPTKKPGHS